ncbi:MAG: LysR family transcriptional regulator [Deltaproteobacteria bacterium]|nr:LysR family transcriptional regulator [Deltaproteobacteria bacterium]
MKVHTKIWLESDAGKLLLGEGRLEIFQAIDRTGSLSAASRELGMSYRAVWGKVRATEERLGIKLVDGVAGGPKHGGTQLTDEAHTFIARFEEFNNRARAAVDHIAIELFDDLIQEK